MTPLPRLPGRRACNPGPPEDHVLGSRGPHTLAAMLFSCARQVHVMVRQMLGAVNQFVAAHAKEILAHGRAASLEAVAQDPSGRRSYEGKPKLGGPNQLLEDDPALSKKMETYAKMPVGKRPSLNNIAKNLRKANKKWSVQKGDNKGKPWAAKQIMMFLKRFRTSAKTRRTRPTSGAKGSGKPTKTTLPITDDTCSGAAAKAGKANDGKSLSANARTIMGSTSRLLRTKADQRARPHRTGGKATRLGSTPRPLPTNADQSARPRKRTRADCT